MDNSQHSLMIREFDTEEHPPENVRPRKARTGTSAGAFILNIGAPHHVGSLAVRVTGQSPVAGELQFAGL